MMAAKTAQLKRDAKFVNLLQIAQFATQIINGSPMAKAIVFAVLDFGETGISANFVNIKQTFVMNVNKMEPVKFARPKEFSTTKQNNATVQKKRTQTLKPQNVFHAIQLGSVFVVRLLSSILAKSVTLNFISKDTQSMVDVSVKVDILKWVIFV